jgi:hypothetical protein
VRGEWVAYALQNRTVGNGSQLRWVCPWTADETQTEQRAISFRRACEVEGKNSLFVLPLESTNFKDVRMYILRYVPSPPPIPNTREMLGVVSADGRMWM